MAKMHMFSGQNTVERFLHAELSDEPRLVDKVVLGAAKFAIIVGAMAVINVSYGIISGLVAGTYLGLLELAYGLVQKVLS